MSILSLLLVPQPYALAQSAGQVETKNNSGGTHWMSPGTCNVKAWGAVSDGVTNDATAITSAISAGCGMVFLPHKTLWTVAGNAMPSGNYTIIGEDSSVVMASSNPSSTYVAVPNGVTVRNISVSDAFTLSYSGTNPRYVQYYYNGSGQTQATVAAWGGQFSMSMGGGGNFFGSCEYGSIGGCNGYDYTYSSSNAGQAHRVSLESTAGSGSVGFQCSDEGSSNGVFCLQFETSTKTSGTMMSVHQENSTYSGDVLRMDMGNAFRTGTNGTFNGYFIEGLNGGAQKFIVTSSGLVWTADKFKVGSNEGLTTTATIGGCTLTFTGGIPTAKSGC